MEASRAFAEPRPTGSKEPGRRPTRVPREGKKHRRTLYAMTSHAGHGGNRRIRRGRRGPRRDVVGSRVGPELGPERGNIPSHLRHHGAHCIELLRRAVRFARSAMIVGHITRRRRSHRGCQGGADRVRRAERRGLRGGGAAAASWAVVSSRRRRRQRCARQRAALRRGSNDS